MGANVYNFIAGTVRGTIIYSVDQPSNLKFTKSEEPSEISALSFGKNFNEVLVGQENGTASIFDLSLGKYVSKIKKLEGDGKVTGFHHVDGAYVISKYDGVVNFYKNKKISSFKTVVKEKSTLNTSSLNEFRENILATGGESNDLKLWDISTQQCVFKAKSLGHDYLNLPIPTTIRGIAFFQENQHLTTCCTKEGHVLMYDDRAQRRPVVKFLEKQASYTTVSTANKEKQCLVGTTRGYLQLIDLKSIKALKTYKSFTGSVTGIYCDPLEPYVVSSSLDRHIRVHHLETKELVKKTYLKQSVSKLLVTIGVKKEEEDNEVKKNNDVTIDEEYEQIFEEMETVGDSRKGKRRKEGEEKQDEESERNKKKKKGKKK